MRLTRAPQLAGHWPDGGRTRNFRRLCVGLGWLAAGAVCLTLDSPESWSDNGSIALGLLAILFGTWVFWRDGGSRITAVGIYNIAFAVFVGFGGVYHGLQASAADPELPLLVGLAVCYFGHVLTWLLFWRAEAPRATQPDVAGVNARTAGWAIISGAVLLAVAAVLGVAAPAAGSIAKSIGFLGVVLVSAGLLRGPIGRWKVLGGLLTLAAFTVYFVYLFNGYGRIVVGTLALALLVILAQGDSRRYTKLIVILGATPVLLFLAAIRAGNQDAPVGGDGLGSVVSPMFSFARLWQLNGAGLLPRGWGDTFFAALVALVPRGWWPEKPYGFGRDLVPFLKPGLADTTHSEAALWYGEWLFNFGLPGIALAIPATGLAVAGIDRLLARASSRPLATPGALGGYLAAVIAAAGLVDLVWVGSFTYMARTGPRLLLLGLLVAIAGWLAGRVSEPATSRFRASGPSRSAGSAGRDEAGDHLGDALACVPVPERRYGPFDRPLLPGK